MKSTQYSEKTLEHFRNPRNVGTLEGENVAVGRVGNPVCGDLMDIYIRVEDDRIADISFQTFGCGSAVATSSMITELVRGKTLDEALEVTRADVADALDGLPPIKMHCSNLAADALHAAIGNWRAGVTPDAALAGGTVRAERPVAAEEPAAFTSGPGTEASVAEIPGITEFAHAGVYARVDDPAELADERVIVIDRGDRSARLAIDLTEHTGRVVLMTPGKEPSASAQLRSALRLSDVKVLTEARLLEVLGEGEVEGVRVHDLNEDEVYELAADAVVLLD